MAQLKTQVTDASVVAFLDGIANDQRRQECFALLDTFERATAAQPRMWGKDMVGFGSYHYKYDSGREGDWFLTGFAPRKAALTLYIMAGFERFDTLMAKLGKHKTGKSCLYVKRLADIDAAVLEQLIRASVAHMKKTYSPGPVT